MTRSPRAAAGVLALVFLALHAPFLPVSLEDLDSLNFALGLRDFDVARHQPHPPGYPVFIAAGKITNRVFHEEVRALSALAVITGALSIPALVFLFGYLDPSVGSRRWAILGAALSASAPLYWFTALRPLSDMPGLAAALGVQALIVRASGLQRLGLSALLAGLAAGIRSQVAWLTLPLLLWAIARRPAAERARACVMVLGGSLAGGLIWFVPLLVASGGPAAYLQALANQGTEDLTGVTMLWTRPEPRQFVTVLWAMFVAPWGAAPVASLVISLATIGALQLLRSSPRTLLTLLIGFGPYAVFSALFQETVTTRYTLPLVPPVAYLAVRGAHAMTVLVQGPERGPRGFLQTAVVVTLVAVNLTVAVPAVQAFSAADAPAFQMLDDMAAAASTGSRPVLAMHRRAELDLRRPLQWVGDAGPSVARRLPSPPKREWLELVRYWNEGGSDDLWFVGDPLRSDLALVGRPRLQGAYRWTRPETPWPFDLFTVLGGVRPSEFDWYVISRPAWYLGEGWALTPEAAGLSREANRGPTVAPIEGWIRRREGAATLMIGGRNAAADGSTSQVRVLVDGQPLHEMAVAPGPFLHMLAVPAGRIAGEGAYATLTVSATGPTPPNPVDLSIKQFDLGGDETIVFGFADGWHDQEYDPETGQLWRWTSDRAVLRVRTGRRPLALHLAGGMEAASRAQVTVRVGDRVLAREDIGRRFSVFVPIPAEVLAEDTNLVIETNQSYVPAEQRWRLRPSTDVRRLGLKVEVCTLTPAS